MPAQQPDEPRPARRSGRPPTVALSDIIENALLLFSERGFRGTSIHAIAARLGLTDSGVLHYFPTKDALIAAVIEHAMHVQTGTMQELVRPGGLRAIEQVGAWGEIMAETPELLALQILLSSEGILEDATVREYVLARYAGVVDLAAGLMREGIERGEIRADVDVEWEARALIAYLDGIRLQWFYSGRQLPIGESVRHYVALLVERLRR